MIEHAPTSSREPAILHFLSEHVVDVADRPVTAGFEMIKRAMDIVIALIGLIITSPLLLAAMVLICVSSPGSPMFTQSRIGRHGKPFMLCKLRTMSKRSAAIRDGLARTRAAIGRVLRKTSIDELPNLVNVLRGEMSIVGPRPMQALEIEYCAERYGDAVNASRLAVKPGITGLWQISGRSDLHFDERVRLDVVYAATWTPLKDLKIIAWTAPAVLFSRGAY